MLIIYCNSNFFPTAPNAQPSLKYDYSPMLDEEEEEEEDGPKGLNMDEGNVDQMKAGDLLLMLKTIARDRGLAGYTKGFRFGISKRKWREVSEKGY